MPCLTHSSPTTTLSHQNSSSSLVPLRGPSAFSQTSIVSRTAWKKLASRPLCALCRIAVGSSTMSPMPSAQSLARGSSIALLATLSVRESRCGMANRRRHVCKPHPNPGPATWAPTSIPPSRHPHSFSSTGRTRVRWLSTMSRTTPTPNSGLMRRTWVLLWKHNSEPRNTSSLLLVCATLSSLFPSSTQSGLETGLLNKLFMSF
mmetsp:Transcript_2276/g.6200  ORF Transcript_2276/g.6200 Transcript_2276/m.6200 type:complete len:204 (-) Transcript_2276:139-750(-)